MAFAYSCFVRLDFRFGGSTLRGHGHIHVVFNSKHSWRSKYSGEMAWIERKWNTEKKNGMKESVRSSNSSVRLHAHYAMFGNHSSLESGQIICRVHLSIIWASDIFTLPAQNCELNLRAQLQDLFSRHLQVVYVHSTSWILWKGEISTNNNSAESSTSNGHICNHSLLFKHTQFEPNHWNWKPYLSGHDLLEAWGCGVGWLVCISGPFLGPWVLNPHS